MTKKHKVAVYELKDSKGEYISKEMDIGITTDLSDAYAVWNKDGSEPNLKIIKESAKAKESYWDNFYKVNYGPDAINNYKPYTWLQHCNLKIVEVDEETFNSIKEEI
ncbi:hypothetical protein [Staphylococcus pseudintermedius]|uniref:hypothetical protein n=1 Tax=Staphylococcus pseudintermedius TaxID=283734 RepID=UPI002B45A6B6|nr:hypothetical protein [Staphylococcus pseudintermedius]